MLIKLTLDLPEEQPYLRISRMLGRTLLTQLEACEQDIDEVELVVGELCANVLRHARSTEQRYRVVIEYHDDRVVIAVEDQGIGFVAKDILPVGAERADFDGQPERIGGYGLKLVELLSDKVQFQPSTPHGTVVRAEKHLRFCGRRAAAVAASN